MEGYLDKKSGGKGGIRVREKWDRRYFTLFDNNLSYYKSAHLALNANPLATLNVTAARVFLKTASDDGVHRFTVLTSERELKLRASSAADYSAWIAALRPLVATVDEEAAPGGGSPRSARSSSAAAVEATSPTTPPPLQTEPPPPPPPPPPRPEAPRRAEAPRSSKSLAETVCSGMMFKKSGASKESSSSKTKVLDRWNRRFFTLNSEGVLEYYRSPDECAMGKPSLGSLPCKGATCFLKAVQGSEFRFTVRAGNRQIKLRAINPAEYRMWTAALERFSSVSQASEARNPDDDVPAAAPSASGDVNGSASLAATLDEPDSPSSPAPENPFGERPPEPARRPDPTPEPARNPGPLPEPANPFGDSSSEITTNPFGSEKLCDASPHTAPPVVAAASRAAAAPSPAAAVEPPAPPEASPALPASSARALAPTEAYSGPVTAQYKLITVGDSGTGKSCLLHRFVMKRYAEVGTTVGVDAASVASFNLGSAAVSLVLWDTAGQERFAPLSSPFYRKADGVLVAFDVGCRESFERATTHWLDQIDSKAAPNVARLLIGLKSDIAAHLRHVSESEAEKLARSRGLLYCEASSLSGDGVDDAFFIISCAIMNAKLESDPTNPEYVTGSDSMGVTSPAPTTGGLSRRQKPAAGSCC